MSAARPPALSIEKCEPGTLYKDAEGTLWRVVGYWTDPVVVMDMVCDADGVPHTQPERRTAGVNGDLWNGFRRLVLE